MIDERIINMRKIKYCTTGNTVEATEGPLKGIKFKEIASDYCLPVATVYNPHDIFMSVTSQALIFQEYLDTSLSFRDFVKKCLKENTIGYGLKDTLQMTGLTYQSYKRGMQADHQRRDSGFNRYLRSLEGIEAVFNALRDVRASVNGN